MNRGYVVGDTYVKNVEFSKAVLWKTKQLSIPPSIFNYLDKYGVKTLIFRGSKEKWIFDLEEVKKYAELKTVGQEAQYYFPISLKVVRKLELK